MNQVRRNNKSKRKQRRQSAGAWNLPNPFSSENRKKARKSLSKAKRSASKKKKNFTRKATKKAKSTRRSWRVMRTNRARKKKKRARSKKLSKLDKKKEHLFNISQDDLDSMSDKELRDREQRIDSLLDEYDEETKSVNERDKKQRREKRMEEKIDRRIRNSGALSRISGEIDEIGDQVKSNTVKLDDVSSTIKKIEKVLDGMDSYKETVQRQIDEAKQEAEAAAAASEAAAAHQAEILEGRDNAPESGAEAGSDIEAEIKRIERGDDAAAAAESTLEGPGNIFDEPRSLGEKISDAASSAASAMPSLGSSGSEPSMANAYAQDINQEVPTTGIEYEGLPSTPPAPGSELERAEPPPPQGPALAGADSGGDEGERDSLAPMRDELGSPHHAKDSQYGGQYYYY